MFTKIAKSHVLAGLLCTVLSFSALPTTASDEILATPTIADVKISPSGDYIAVRVSNKQSLSLRFLDRKSLVQLGELEFARDQAIGDFFWASKDRVVAEILDNNDLYTGKLLAINYDGSEQALIQDSNKSDQSNLLPLKVVDPLTDNGAHILVSAEPLISENGHRGIATLLNIYGDLGNSEFAQSSSQKTQDHALFIDFEGEIQIATTNP